LMAGIGFVLMAVAALYFMLLLLKKRVAINRWLLRAIVACVPLAFLGVEMGWFFAEIGRQPWMIRGYLRVEEAATSSPSVVVLFFLFLLLYIVLGILCFVVLRRLFRNKPADLEFNQAVQDKELPSAGKEGSI
ncbi:cytochrome ubiquinol oxidase subunit I, partial [Mycobacterium tuberculosis]